MVPNLGCTQLSLETTAAWAYTERARGGSVDLVRRHADGEEGEGDQGHGAQSQGKGRKSRT